MTPAKKELVTIIIGVVAALTILAAAWFLNGSEFEDAWLYISAAWIVIIPLWDIIAKRFIK